MVNSGIIHIESDRLFTKIEDRVTRWHRDNNDHVLRLLDLDFVNTFQPLFRNEDRKRPWGVPASPAGGRDPSVTPASPAACSGGLRKRRAPRRGTALRALDMQVKMG